MVRRKDMPGKKPELKNMTTNSILIALNNASAV